KRHPLAAPPGAAGVTSFSTDPPLFSDRRQGSLVLTAGSRAYIYLTSDGGDTWTAHPLPAVPAATDFIKTPDFWILGGGCYHSGDGGVDWKTSSADVGFDADTMQFEGTDHGWALVGASGAEA